ncbi:MAG: Gfo/Idh/MocA family oxidoreductase [Armatimonadota bacterium]|nr:Gfo/Idh/MocA family oxidoreductase [Armatimonadota bacterium]
MSGSKTKIGVIGCGNISSAYLGASNTFPILEIAACADLDVERAKQKASEFNVPRACTVPELLAMDDLEIVVNLTIPQAHVPVGIAALEAGKSTYSEKPMSVDRLEGKRLLDAGRTHGLRVGCAPDTFMGGGFQTCRKLIDDGWIGEPIGASAFMTCHGHESWHPDPNFYYQHGGGPMFDMGPYYITALVSILGPIRRVTGSARITFPERTITSQPRYGQVMKVNVPTHVAGVMDFASGAVGTILTSFDVWGAELPRIEIYGTEGSLSCPDPNGFGGPVMVRRAGASAWSQIPLIRPEAHRGIGVADMAAAMQANRPHRASGELAYHVLDVMQAYHDASAEGRHIEIGSECGRPEPLPVGLFADQLG